VKRRSLICLITDRRRLSPEFSPEESLDRLVELVGVAARAGVDLIQLRERDLEGRRLAMLADRCVSAAGRTPVLVNDRVDVALAAGAAGVHLRSDSVDGMVVRKAVHRGFLIGRSVHSLTEAASATRAAVLDYLIFGTVYETASKPAGHSVAGADSLAQICATVQLPVLAVGGITLARASQVAGTGAAGVAAIGMFIPPKDVPAERHVSNTVDALRRTFDTR